MGVLRAVQVAARQGLCAVYTQSMSLEEVLRQHLEEPAQLFSERINYERMAGDLEQITHHRSLRPGERLFSVDEPSSELYIIESGTINMQARVAPEELPNSSVQRRRSSVHLENA